MENTDNHSQFIIYQTEDGETRLDVRFQDETVWLTQALMAELFQTSKHLSWLSGTEPYCNTFSPMGNPITRHLRKFGLSEYSFFIFSFILGEYCLLCDKHSAVNR
ncbi:hypothetical protein [Photorhabdus khanii]|uniref:hypothetical protein n=1 Tax=Photorhabdus khanii TaxID=1004150 RepID=UPI001EEF89E5|nr:hypothetical protein [Photorhabdus khanii]